MVMWTLILSFLASLLPPFRDYFKKELRKFYIYIGAMFMLVQIIMGIYVFPKLLVLFKQSNLEYNTQQGTILIIVSFVLAVLMLIAGIKYVKYYKSNLQFYFMFALLVVISDVIIEIDISNIINSIYSLVNNLK